MEIMSGLIVLLGALMLGVRHGGSDFYLCIWL